MRVAGLWPVSHALFPPRASLSCPPPRQVLKPEGVKRSLTNLAVVDGFEAPAEFCWRGWSWQVRQVQGCWKLTSPWWESPAARAVRDGSIRLDEDDRGELLHEVTGWRVLAERGSAATGSQRAGVFGLHHDSATGWRLDRVID